jgi:hypothetical protein
MKAVHVPPKRRLAFKYLHGVISQKTEHFIKYYCENFKSYLLVMNRESETVLTTVGVNNSIEQKLS